MQDKFFSDIKDTWQSVELPHQELLKKARRNLILHRCGLAYNIIFTICSVALGIWLGSNNQHDALYWLASFTAIFIIPTLAIYSIKLSWPYGHWQDKTAVGTLEVLIKQSEMKVKFTKLLRPLAISYFIVPIIALGAHHLKLTSISYDLILGFSVGIMSSTCIMFIWVHYKLPRLRKELEKLLCMQKEWKSFID
jgi:hypothetical protein